MASSRLSAEKARRYRTGSIYMGVVLLIYPLALRVSFGIASTVYRSVMDLMRWSILYLTSCGPSSFCQF